MFFAIDRYTRLLYTSSAFSLMYFVICLRYFRRPLFHISRDSTWVANWLRLLPELLINKDCCTVSMLEHGVKKRRQREAVASYWECLRYVSLSKTLPQISHVEPAWPNARGGHPCSHLRTRPRALQGLPREVYSRAAQQIKQRRNKFKKAQEQSISDITHVCKEERMILQLIVRNSTRKSAKRSLRSSSTTPWSIFYQIS